MTPEKKVKIKEKVKTASSRVSPISPSSNPSEAFSTKKVDSTVFLKEFDGLLNKGDFDKPSHVG